MKVGVAGLGRMGYGMARALRAGGVDVVGFDVAPREGAWVAPDARSFAHGITTLITVVRDAAETDAVLFDEQAVLAHAPHLDTVILSSTLSPRYVMALRDRVPTHIHLIDAPMSGAQIAADEARLTFMLGGAEEVLDRHQPLFDLMGQRCHRMGAFGQAAAAKVLNNLVAASSVAATRTALAWADALGLAEDRLLALMHDSSGQTWFGSNFDAIEFSRDGLAEDNTIAILVKDVAAALDAAPAGADRELAAALISTISSLEPR